MLHKQLANVRLFTAAPDLLAVCKDYEQWEADLILCGDSWTTAGPPRLTQEQCDKLIEIQGRRNAAIAKATNTESDQ